MRDNTITIKTVVILCGSMIMAIGATIFIHNLIADGIAKMPLPHYGVYVQMIVVLLFCFALLAYIDKMSELFKQTFNVELVKRVILTMMLLSSIYIPLFYGYFVWLPSFLGQKFAQMEYRWLLLMLSVFFIFVVGSCYYLFEKIWPNPGKVKWGIFLSSSVISAIIIVSLWQTPYKLFNRDGTSNVMYNPVDFQPNYNLKISNGEKIYDERDGEELVQLTRETSQEVVQNIRTNIPNIKDVLMFWKWKKATADNQISVEESNGWKINSDGMLVASLSLGDEATRPFFLKDGQSTPTIIIPEDNYNFRFTNLQTIVVTENGRKKIVHPDNYYEMGITKGVRKFKFKALQKGANIILHIERR